MVNTDETAFNWFIQHEMIVSADETAFNWFIQNEMIVNADKFQAVKNHKIVKWREKTQ